MAEEILAELPARFAEPVVQQQIRRLHRTAATMTARARTVTRVDARRVRGFTARPATPTARPFSISSRSTRSSVKHARARRERGRM